MIRFQDLILKESVPIIRGGGTFLVDLDSLCPYEPYTTYPTVRQAEGVFMDGRTPWLIERIKAGLPIAPIMVQPFHESELDDIRDKEVLALQIPKWKYTIQDGNHRYFAYRTCGIKKVPVTFGTVDVPY